MTVKTDWYPAHDEIEISTRHLVHGIYFILIRDDRASYLARFLKQWFNVMQSNHNPFRLIFVRWPW